MTEPSMRPEDVTTPPGESGLTSDPDGSVGDRMPPISENLEQSGDAEGGRTQQDLPAANQRRAEPFPPSPSQESHTDTTFREPASSPPDTTRRTTPPETTTPTSAAVSMPAVALPGKPDGEVDTRV